MYPTLSTDTDSPDYKKGDFSQGMPAHNGAKDLVWAGLYLVHLLVVALLAYYGKTKRDEAVAQGSGAMSNQNPLSGLNINSDDIQKIGTLVVMTSMVGILVAMFWLFLMRRWPKKLIYFTMFCQIVMSLAVAGFMLYTGAYIGAIFGLAGVLCTLCVWYMWRHRIPFAAAILGTVARVMKLYRGMIVVPFVALVVQSIWSALWGYSSSMSFYYVESATMGYIVYVFFTLSLYWSSEVIRNTAHVTVAGCIATWYFLADGEKFSADTGSSRMPRNPTLLAGKRALTTSFGSICFGSLIVALIQTIRAILRSLARQRGGSQVVQIIICLVDCLLGCLESLIRMFNDWAYCQVAIYGKSFCTAAKDTWKLAQSHGLDAIMSTSFIQTTLTMGALLGGFICFLAGAGIGAFVLETPVMGDGDDYTWAVFGAIGSVIGYIMLATVCTVVASGAKTIFVCFAMDPGALKVHDPELAQRLEDAWNNVQSTQQSQRSSGRRRGAQFV